MSEAASNVAQVEFLGGVATFPLLAGTRPDLYRAFMCRVWSQLSTNGTAGLIHPDSHFSGVHEGRLRAITYRHLRFHGHFQNRRLLFPEIGWTRQYSVNVYGQELDASFAHLSWLFDPSVIIPSLEHDGSGEAPSIKYRGTWDLRPHASRVVLVNFKRLGMWRRLWPDFEGTVEQAPLLYPVTTHEERAIEALTDFPLRLGSLDPWISRGLNESKAVRDGLIRRSFENPIRWEEVILRGPQFSVATPFAKQPPKTGTYDPLTDVTSLHPDAVPSTDYVRACDSARYSAAQDIWGDRRSTEFYRLVWRRRIPYDTERSLFAAIVPPGPSHIHAVHSLAMGRNVDTALAAAFWSSLPLDYFLRVTARADLQQSEVRAMPAGSSQHPLATSALLRTLRLNCLTSAYSGLWVDLFDSNWANESWACDWPGLDPIGRTPDGALSAEWNFHTPLRSERARRAALVELDVLVSVWLGIGYDELVAIYFSRFPQLARYEADIWFDGQGRKIAEHRSAFGVGQTKEHFGQLMLYLDDPDGNPVPDGYAAPFYKADRESEYRQAHAVFSKRLQDAIDMGWQPS